jgi:putative membrane protein
MLIRLMLIELFIALVLGLIIGSITGIIPGIHINLVAIFLLSLASLNIPFLSPIFLVIFIVSMSITHTLVDFIPSIFLGCPDENNALSVLPGHKYLLEGKGYHALVYTLYGSALGLMITLLLIPLFIFIVPSLFYYLRFAMFIILVTASVYLVMKDKDKILALILFLLSGLLGLIVLNLNIPDSLLPMLSGLFGSSSLITSIVKKQKIPPQNISKFKEIKVSLKELKNIAIASLISTPLCSFLPALGSSQAAIIGSDMLEEKNQTPNKEAENQKEFLILLGSINIIVLALSFITFYSIGKTRTGAAVAVSNLLPSLSTQNLLLIIAAIVLSGFFAFLISLFLAKRFSRFIPKVNYSLLSLIVLIFLSLIVIIFSGLLGFLVFLVSTSVGLTAIYSGARRTHLMGSLMLTSIIFYIPF